MTNEQRVLEFIRLRPGITDAELRRKSGVEPHQQVNQICRVLVNRGLVVRRVGRDGAVLNFPSYLDLPATAARAQDASATSTDLRRESS